ncbi:MAG: class I SAM-dependent methyltransferase [Solirubrobacteraceae bacterium]|nr:class I SAM-dependent methyltransferase [Solirubrobacteraceae bacterium]
MTQAPELHATRCAICGTTGNATERWPATLTPEAFSVATFSARRLPDRVHYRMVTCDACGLVRSDPVMDSERLDGLYEQSTFDYGDELPSLERTYGEAIGLIEERLGDLPKSGIADVGCGNGFVLDQALARGWSEVWGVEPSSDAIGHASPEVGPRIKQAMMTPGLFEPGSLSGITLFQVLDHLPDPLEPLAACREALRPGGVVLAWNHNVRAVSARLLGDRSPIVDVEHTYLYSPDTMRKLFEKAGFVDVKVRPVRNRYSVSYLTHLVPIPRTAKEALLPPLRRSRIGRRELRVPLGNLCLTAINPG